MRGLLNRNCSSQNKPNSSWCVGRDEHSNPGGGKAEVVRTGRAVSLQHVHTQRRCVDMPLLLPRLTDSATTICKLLQSTSFFFLFKVEGKKKCIITAILSQHRRGLPFVFIKRLIKNIEKFSSFLLYFFFNLVEFWSFLENYVTLERALEFTTSCKEDTQNAYKQFGAPAHTRPNAVHKQWWKVGCNFFFFKPC